VIRHRLSLASLLLAPCIALAAEGALDPAFANGTGALFHSYRPFLGAGVADEIARGIAIAADGRITVVGDFLQEGSSTDRDCGLLRTLPDATAYDTGFMPIVGYGYYVFNLGGPDTDYCHAIALDGSSGTGFFVGSATLGHDGQRTGLIVRFRPNGSPEPGFFGDGIYHSHVDGLNTLGAEDAEFRQVIVDRAGRVVVSGDATFLTGDGLVAHGVALRFNANGTPDTSFVAGSSVAVLQNGADGSTLHVNASAEAADGGYWFAGHREDGVGATLGRLFRITPQGGFDAQVGGANGLDITACQRVQSMALDEAGRVLLGCLPSNAGLLPGVLRLVRSGGQWIADATFGSGGFAELRISAGDTPGLWPGVTRVSAVRASGGRILVAGAYDPGRIPANPGDLIVVRLMSDGSKDNTFGNSGVTRLDFGPGADQHDDAATAMALDAQARPVVVGQRKASSGGTSSYIVTRLQHDDLLLRDGFE
jgi:uncharacterized delta-60 repeat protein